MRLAVLFAIVGVLAVAALFRPKIGLFGYIWFAVVRPDYLAWVAGEYPMSLVLAATTLTGTLINQPMGITKVFSNPISRLVLLLQVPIILSVVFAVIPQLAFPPLYLYWRVVLMALLILVLIDTKKDLIILAMVLGVSLGFLSAKMGVVGVLSGGIRYAAGYAGMLSDNNTYALALAMGLPICWYLKELVSPKWLKLTLMGMAAASVPGVLMTYSRGVAVSMGVGIILIAFRSKHRIMMLPGVAIFAVVLFSFLGGRYQERISTVLDPTSEASSNSRIVFAQAAIAMAMDYPVLGVGFGHLNQGRLMQNYTGSMPSTGMVVHNSYLQVLTDSGVSALIIYLALLGITMLMLQKSYMRWKPAGLAMTAIPLMLQTSLVIFAVDSLVLSRDTFDIYFMILMMSAAWFEIEKTERKSETPVVKATPTLAQATRQPLSTLPAPMPVSRQQTEVPLSRQQPKVGIASARQAELQENSSKSGRASS